jgi:hypothetical protein
LRRIIKVLAATALMVVLMSTIVSPAFAAKDTCRTFGYGCQEGGGKEYDKYTGQDGGPVYGWACGSKTHEGPYNDKYC